MHLKSLFFRYKQLLLKSVLPEDEFDKWGIQLLTPVPACSHTPEADAGPVISIQVNIGDAPPASLRFHNLSGILWVNPQRVPASPARCSTPSDAHVIHQVTRASATVSDTAGKKGSLRAQLLKILDPNTLPKPKDCAGALHFRKSIS